MGLSEDILKVTDPIYSFAQRLLQPLFRVQPALYRKFGTNIPRNGTACRASSLQFIYSHDWPFSYPYFPVLPERILSSTAEAKKGQRTLGEQNTPKNGSLFCSRQLDLGYIITLMRTGKKEV